MDVSVEPNRRRPRFRRAEQTPAFQFTDRDVEIVRQVARHRFLRSTHISILLDASHKKICERLTLLFHVGYLDRPRSQLEYYVRGGGSAHCVYALGNRGAQVLRERDAMEHTNVDWARKNRDMTRQFLLHTLAIADFRVALATACRARQDIYLHESTQLFETLPEETRSSRSPWNWRVRVQHNGSITDIGLLPDYVFALILQDSRRRPFVVECDRGSMPIQRATLDQTSILRKLLTYEGGYRQGIHTSRFGWKNFRVLIVAASNERANNIRALIRCTPEIKDSPLFLVATRSVLAESNVLVARWLDANGRTHALV